MNALLDYWRHNKTDRRVGSPASVLRYYLRRGKAIRREAGHVGCAEGFRTAARLSNKRQLAALQCGEDAVGLNALIFNGAHPDYRNDYKHDK